VTGFDAGVSPAGAAAAHTMALPPPVGIRVPRPVSCGSLFRSGTIMDPALTHRLAIPAALAGAVLLLAGAGALWLRNGASVFFDILSAGLAACL